MSKLYKKILVLSILVICSCFFLGFAEGSKDFNIPIYIQTSAGIEKASSDDIIDILANHDFEIQEKQEYVPDEKCSLRAKGGSLEIDGMIFDSKNTLSFNIPLKNDGPGQGSLIVQKDGNRFSLDFEVQEILETNSERLVFIAKGEGKLNREKVNIEEIIVTFDKINNKVEIAGKGDEDFEITGMEVTFTEGCFGGEKKFYLIIDKGKLEEMRSIEEVRRLLKEHPELIDMYEGLGLYSGYNIIPEFDIFIGALTLISAVGIFFLVRRK